MTSTPRFRPFGIRRTPLAANIGSNWTVTFPWSCTRRTSIREAIADAQAPGVDEHTACTR
jgi:hypothetical protein